MQDIEFVMTYPCSVPLRSNQMPITFTAEGAVCVGIFTDAHLLDQWYEMNSQFERLKMTIDDAANLCDLLEWCDQKESGPGRIVSHVILDPLAGRKARVYPIRDFVSHIQD